MKTLTRSILQLVILALLIQPVPAQSLPIAQPQEVGLSPGRLQRLDQAMQAYVDLKRLPGAVTLVARKGRIAHLRAYGMMDIEANKIMRPDSIFRIASMSKAITSVAIMMLHEEGRLLLNDPLSKYLPEFQNMQVLVPNNGKDANDAAPYKLVPAKRPITIHHLLTHTSGISYKFAGKKYLADLYRQAGVSDGLSQTEGTLAQNVWKIAKQPLRSQPGEEWEYGLSTDVLGRVVEVVSGMSFADFLEQRVFKPLGMNDTYFFLPPEKVARLAAVYRPVSKENGGLEKYGDKPYDFGPLTFSASYPYSGPMSYYSGGAGLVSTAADYWRFLQMTLNGGELNGVRLLSRKSIELMTAGVVSMGNPDDAYKFGLGFSVRQELGKARRLGSVGEYNWGGFFHTAFFVDPKEDLIAILLTQLYPAGDLDDQEKFRTLVYQSIVE